MVLGWMSTRVLGQYDLLIIEDESPHDQDLVYYVGPNMLSLEKQFAFPPREFRLWLALHEVTHRAQFTGVAVDAPATSSVSSTQTLDAVDPDPKRFLAVLGRVGRGPSQRRQPARRRRDHGSGRDATSSATVLDQVSGLMSLLEGHGDVTMDRAGAGLDPERRALRPGAAPAARVDARAWPACSSS